MDNVELYFKSHRVLNGIYLKGETGKVSGLLGRNGSGKSSLMDIAFGILKPKYMLIRLNNKPLQQPLYKLKIAKYMPQYNFIPSSMKVAFAFQLYRVDWQAFVTLFNNFEPYKDLRDYQVEKDDLLKST